MEAVAADKFYSEIDDLDNEWHNLLGLYPNL